MEFLLWALLYLFIGGICVGWWFRCGVFEPDEGMLGVAALLWPIGIGFELGYRTAQVAVWLVRKFRRL